MDTSWRTRYARNKNLFARALEEYNEKASIKAYLELILSCITISVFGLFALRPTVITIGNLIKEIREKEKTLTIMKDKIDKLGSAQFIYGKEKTQINLLKQAVPDSPSPQDLIHQIESLTSLNATTLTNLSLNDMKLLTDDSSNVRSEGTLFMSMVLTGSYNDLSNFIAQLENMRRPIKIDTLDFTPNLSSGSNIVTLSLGNMTLPYTKVGADESQIIGQ